ncbi:MAG TPA: ABC transporter permease [Trueperaceae bacterium]|nr:ABC transporter permease [Trueperaceae bacterium]
MATQTPQTQTGAAPSRRARAARAERQGASLSTIAWKQFRQHPLARGALLILGILYTAAAFADFLAPYPERYINTNNTFQPPTQVHFRDEDGRWSRPYIYPMKKSLDLQTFQTVWEVDTSQKYYLKFFVRREGIRDRYVPFPVSLIPLKLRQTWDIRPTATLHLFGVDDPTDRVKVHLWGTDDLGGDVFGKVLFGARISLTIGILASLVAIAIGMLMGGLAGFYGGWLDELILRLVEAIDAIPSLFLLLTLSAVFYPLGLPSSVVFPLIVVVLSLIGWGGVARTIRAQVLSLKERDFAVAAKAAGASNWRIIRAHLLPQTLSYVIVVMSLAIPGFILTEAVLSFFGLGIQPPATSWGLMLNTAQSFVGVSGLGDRWWIFIPGIFIFVSVLTWNLLGDGLRDAFDPRSRR